MAIKKTRSGCSLLGRALVALAASRDDAAHELHELCERGGLEVVGLLGVLVLGGDLLSGKKMKCVV